MSPKKFTAKINLQGLIQIQDALGLYHRLGQDHFTSAMIHAWASDAEAHWDNHGSVQFEIPAKDSIRRKPITVNISQEGYDLEEIEPEVTTLTSRQLFESQDQTPIPVNGKFKFFDKFGTISAERVVENTLPAAEFRDLAVQARRKAAELIEVADEMDAWLLQHLP